MGKGALLGEKREVTEAQDKLYVAGGGGDRRRTTGRSRRTCGPEKKYERRYSGH